MQRKLVGIAHNLRGDIDGQIFSERRLRKGALPGAHCSRGGADGGVAEQPADRPTKGGQSRRIDTAAVNPKGKGEEKG